MRRTMTILPMLLSTSLLAHEPVDLEVVHSIKQEALENSRVMDHVFYLVEVHGPRLTGSPGFRGAADWAVERLQEWGLENARQEPWGPFGQGWSYTRFSAHLVEPQYEALIGVPLGWTPGTAGVVRGEPLIAPFRGGSSRRIRATSVDRYINQYRGKLAGRIVLFSELKDVEGSDSPLFSRFTEEDLEDRASAPTPRPREDFDYRDRDQETPARPGEQRSRRQQNRLNQFLSEEGVALLIRSAWRGDGGTVFPPPQFPPYMGSRNPKDPLPPPAIALTPEHYNRVFRLTARGIPTSLEVEVRTRFHTEKEDSLNVVGDLPGTGKPDELVMVGAHLDSVAPGLGATDNAAGCAVMMEVIRILTALQLPLDRTIRIALWGGEEQGRLGSKAHVEEHFADRATMELKPDHAKLSAYYNLDNGTGRIRGVYLQENEMVRPLFADWLAPFSDMGAGTLSIRNTRGTDHLSFDAVGLPGFQFIQDPIEYLTRSHHSNMDLYDRIQPGDLAQAAAIIATFVYQTANREELLPRKPLPRPQSGTATPGPAELEGADNRSNPGL